MFGVVGCGGVACDGCSGAGWDVGVRRGVAGCGVAWCCVAG